jgi:endonuclease/exonuclease/phosphatase family metal-dependent hydrolase
MRPILGPPHGQAVHVMSYNLRYPADDPGRRWPDRRPLMAELLRAEAPTVIGTQEGVDDQLRDLATDLPDRYDWIGAGRDGGVQGEFAAIFFDSDRLAPQDDAHFWLSDRPHEAGSRTWGNTMPRIATWVRFTDRSTGREFVVLNTHFDHRASNARERSAELIASTVESFGAPTIVVGDFNAAAEDSRTYDLLVGGTRLLDSWHTAERRLSSAYATYSGYQAPVIGGARIDWLLTTPEFTVDAVAINSASVDGRFPSDHLPVQAHVRLTPTGVTSARP